MMIAIQSHPEIPDIKIISNKVFTDKRGWFTETFRSSWLEELNQYLGYTWVQENVSCSSKNTLRGLHYQIISPQAKWVRVLNGSVLDVAVDLRVSSPSFGKSVSIELNALDGKSVVIPVGFAHGFLAQTDSTIFSYKCSDYYNPAGERGIKWDDPSLKIAWGISSPEVSEKDIKLPLLKSLSNKDLF